MIGVRFVRWNERDWKARKVDHINADVTANPDGCFVAVRNAETLGCITTRVDRANSRGHIPHMAVVESARVASVSGGG